MRTSSTPNIDFQSLLQNPDSKLEDVILSDDFINYWNLSDPNLFSFLIKHYGELIDIGFQTRTESILSIRCLQIISSNPFFRHRFFTETNFLNFIYNYIFNISTFPECSQRNYFYALPNIVADQLSRIEPIFNDKFFTELFKNIQNDFAYNFILRLINYAPISFAPILKEVKVAKMIITNIIDFLSIKNPDSNTKLLLIRNQNIYKALIHSKFDDNTCSAMNDGIDEIINKAIESPNKITLSFIEYIDEFSIKKFSLSKWHEIHEKIIPHLSAFCEIVTNSKIDTFTSLSEACTLLAIGITSTTHNESQCFHILFERLAIQFFELKNNAFLHNCFLKAFNLLLSIGKINASYLDELDLFNKITNSYEKRDNDIVVSYWGQLYLISRAMRKFVKDSKTVDLIKWDKFVAEKNKWTKKVISNHYGGFVPPNVNPNAYKLKNDVGQTFFSRNLFITIMKSDKKNTSPLS